MPNRDGILQITESLQQYDDLGAIHIVSHGDVGELSLGSSKLNQNTLNNYLDSLTSWTHAITETADILLYGCNVAGDPTGEEFVESLSQYTAADILASTDLTGSAELGGDWDLEFSFGEIDAQLAFKAEVKTNYEQILYDSFSFSPPPGGFNNNFGSDSGFDDFVIDDRFTLDPYDPLDYDLDFDFGLDNFDGYSDFDNDSDSGFDLDNYDFSNPQINSDVLDFTPAKINFNPTDLDII
ncbi:MAG: DUF4347 domain-containing protein [Cyanobacteria bacterium P01_G01_bin.67]